MDYWKKENIKNYLIEIAKFYKDCSSNKFYGMSLPEKLNKEEKQYLNNNLKLDEIVGVEKHLVLNETLKKDEKDNFSFYLIRTLGIDIDVNSFDESKNTVFIQLSKRHFYKKSYFCQDLLNYILKRGYKIKKEDDKYITNSYKNIKKQSDFDRWVILRFAVKLNNSKKFNLATLKDRELFTILSFKMNKPIHFKFPNLLGISNNAILHYRESGDIILKAMNYYGVTSKVEKLDRKRTFRKKRNEYNENKPIQDKEFENLVFDLFPELT